MPGSAFADETAGAVSPSNVSSASSESPIQGMPSSAASEASAADGEGQAASTVVQSEGSLGASMPVDSGLADSAAAGPVYYSASAVSSGEKPFKAVVDEGDIASESRQGNAASKVAAAAAAVAKAAKAGVGAGESATVHASPMPTLPNPTTEEFIALIGEQARQIAQENGLYASVMIAQAILESGSGGSGLSKPPYNNLFGIKGSYKGSAVYMLTSEDDGTGRRYDIMAAFRSYPSTRESLQDYADLLTKSMGSFYAPAWKANAATYADACDYLQGHYATSTSYSASLQGLILAYNLEQFDHPATQDGTDKANADHAKEMLVALPFRDGRAEPAAEAGVEAPGSEVNGAPVEAGKPDARDDAGSEAERETSEFVAFAQSPGMQLAAFGICPVTVLLVMFLRGGWAALGVGAANGSASVAGAASGAKAWASRFVSRIAVLLK